MEKMRRHISIKKVNLLTFISFIITILFLYIFAEIADQFYTGWDRYTNKNELSMLADIMFMLLLLVDFIGAIICVIYPFKTLLGKFNRKSQL